MRPPKTIPAQMVKELQQLLKTPLSVAEFRRIQAVLLRADLGLPPEQIAQSTGLKLNTVRVLHSRVLREGTSALLDKRESAITPETPTKKAPSALPQKTPAAKATPAKSNAPQVANDVSMRQLADLAGVSKTTVSLALRNDLSLPPQTRTSIQSLAEKLQYRPDPDIHQLMEKVRLRKKNHSRNTIGYIVVEENAHEGLNNPFATAYYEGSLAHARKWGYNLDVFKLNKKSMPEKRLGEILYHRGVNGILIAPLPKASTFFQSFPWHLFSVVALGYSLLELSLCRASSHQFQCMSLLVRTLQSQGYRRIGLALEQDVDTRVLHTYTGAFAACKRPALALGEDLFLCKKWSLDAFARWLDRFQPDVIISANPIVKVSMQKLGIRSPDEIGIADACILPGMEGCTGIDQNSNVITASAIDLLLSLMRTGERGLAKTPRTVMAEGCFVQGITTLTNLP